jgi:hypothetical protein
MEDLAGLYDFSGVFGLHRDGINGVAVAVVANKRAVVAGAGWSYKFTGLISVDLTSGFDDGCIATVGAGAIG